MTDEQTEFTNEPPQPAQDGDQGARTREDAPGQSAGSSDGLRGWDGEDRNVLGTETITVPIGLSDEEVAELGKRLAAIEPQIDELKAQVKDLNADIRELRTRRTVLSQEIRNGTGNRPVVCKLIGHFDRGKVEVVREDTGEIVEMRDMTDDQRQMRMADPAPTCDDCALVDTCEDHAGGTRYIKATVCPDFLDAPPEDNDCDEEQEACQDVGQPPADEGQDNDCNDTEPALWEMVADASASEAKALLRESHDVEAIQEAIEHEQHNSKSPRKSVIRAGQMRIKGITPDTEPGQHETGPKGNGGGSWPECHCGQPSVTTKDGEHLCAEHGFDPADDRDDPFGEGE